MDEVSSPHSAPRAIDRRDVIFGGCLIAAAGLAAVRTPRTRVIAIPSGPIEGAVPTTIGSWISLPTDDLVMPPDDERSAAAVYEDQITRTYSDGASSIMLMIAYARRQSSMLMVHRPESCYPGSGFTITNDYPLTIPLARNIRPTGRFLSTERDDRVEQVLYWTRLGNRFPEDWDAERASLAMQSLQGLLPDGALVRLSAISPDPDAAKRLLLSFAAAMFEASGPTGRALLGGPPQAHR